MSMSSHTGQRAEDESCVYEFLTVHGVEKAFDNQYYMWNYNGSVSQVMKFKGINAANMTESDYQELFATLTRLVVSTASPDITICFHLFRDAKPKTYELPSDLPVHLLERAKFAQEMIKEGEVLQNSFYISVNCYPIDDNMSIVDKARMAIKNAKSFMDKTTNLDVIEKKQQGIKRRVSKISSTIKAIQAVLKPLGMYAGSLSEQEYWDLLRMNTAPSLSKLKDHYHIDKHDVNESPRQALFAGVTMNERPDHFIMDDYLHQVYELDRVSSRVRVSAKDILYIMNAPYELSYTIAFNCMDYKKSNKVFTRALAEAKRDLDLATDNNGKVSDPGLMYDYQKVNQSYHEMAEKGLGAIQYAAVLVIKQRMKHVARIMHEQNISTISDYIFDFKEALRQSVFAKFAQSEWNLAEMAQPLVWSLTLPGMCALPSGKLRVNIDVPNNVPFLLPLYSQNRDDLDYFGFNHFFTDSMGLCTFENFDPRLQSWGTLVSGDMGSGKSVTINLYLSMAYTSRLVSGKNPILRIVDFGGPTSSYFKLIKILKGTTLNFVGPNKPCIQIMELSPNASYPNKRKMEEIENHLRQFEHLSGLTNEIIMEKIASFYESKMSIDGEISNKQLQEFSHDSFGLDYELIKDITQLRPGECRPDSATLQSIMSVLEVMLSNDPKRLDAFTSEFSRDDVLMFVNHAYETIEERFPRISDLVELIDDYIAASGAKTLGRMANRLRNWTVKEGSYKMFDRETNIDLSNDTIMFDLYGLDSDPHLEAIYMMLITKLITKDMYEKMDRVRLVTLDEVWASAKTKAMQDVLAGFFRLSRKYKFQPVMASQLPTDYYNLSEDFGNVIVSQARNYIICGLSDERVIRETARIYNLPEEHASQIKSLGVGENPSAKHGKRYARFMQITKLPNSRSISIFRSILSPFEFALINSNKEDNAIARYYLDKMKIDIVETCKIIAERRFVGDEGLIEFLREGNHKEALKMATPGR